MNRAGATPLSIVFAAVATVCVAIVIYTEGGAALGQRRTQGCDSNLKQLGLAFLQYTQDNDETLSRAWYGKDAGPSSTVNYKWEDAIDPYIESSHVFECPSDYVNKPFQPYVHQFPYPAPNTNYGSYVFNNAYYASGDKYTPPGGQKLSKVAAGTVLVMDGENDFQFAWPDAQHAPKITGTNPARLGPITTRHYGPYSEVPVTLWVDGSVHNYSLQQIAAEKTIHGQKIYTGFTIERD